MDLRRNNVSKTSISKITLGTVQLGIKYGIANRTGKPTEKDSQKILEFAYDQGINMFDTAPAYGNSEVIIGNFIRNFSSDKSQNTPEIITKLSPFEILGNEDEIFKKIKNSVIESLNRLHLDKIPYFLLHNAEDIHKLNGKIVEALIRLREEGYLNHIGVSIYNPDEVKLFLEKEELDVIQIPINILDHRLIKTGLLKELHFKNKIIFARSVFLQGLIFMNPKELPDTLKIAAHHLHKLAEIAKRADLSIAQLSFCFVRDMKEISSIIMGVDNLDQLKENLNYLNLPPLGEKVKIEILNAFTEVEEKIVNPSKWVV
ncbi:aldo/keto reductase [Promethearchaeum syntrophicum]|uniref:Aldo/keto reductase n=1 Tax=Promethearchaeum syntrophicum TaxID=2594042 RepID=A0A5B9DAK2_9ARCH|nr:aldo/keto reductase [Candidatus Prometheoarchaeum syntrophicum]